MNDNCIILHMRISHVIRLSALGKFIRERDKMGVCNACVILRYFQKWSFSRWQSYSNYY